MTDRSEESAEMTTGTTPPPITDALRAQAKAHPGDWVYAIDPGFDGQENVPPHGVIGAWKSSPQGELEPEFTANPNYRATPQARGWSQPGSPLEDTLQLVLSGYAPAHALDRQFASDDVFIFGRPEGGIYLAPAQDGGQVVYAYTDEAKAKASGYEHISSIRGSELAAQLPGDVRIALNPGELVAAVLKPSDVTEAA